MTPETLTIAAAAVRLYAESHPRPIQVTKTDAAKMLGISRPTVDSLIRAGTLSLNRFGKIPISQIDAALVADGEQRTVRIGAGFGGPWGIFGELGEIPRAPPATTQPPTPVAPPRKPAHNPRSSARSPAS